MSDEQSFTETDAFEERGEAHGEFLGISELSYAHMLDEAVLHALATPAPAADPTWYTIGPRNVGGRITAIAQDPTNANILYAGSAHGGLWVSRDAGDTWSHVGGPEHSYPVGTIAVPRQRPGSIYIGTGSMAARYVAGRGLFRVDIAADPAASVFTQLAPPPPETASPGDPLSGSSLRYTRLRVDPENPERFWAASQTGLWRFEPKSAAFVRDFPPATDRPDGTPNLATNLDFAGQWPEYCSDVLVARDPREDETVTENGTVVARYLIVHIAIDSAGVFRGRFDRGSGGDPPEMKWEKKLDVPDEDLYAGGRAFTRIRLALCEAHPNVLYAVFASNPGSGIAEHNHASFVFRSDDNGDDWQIRGRIPRAFLCDDSGGPNNGQASYDLLLEANPSNPDVVVCGEIDVCLSTDRAGTWTPILEWQTYDVGDYAQHADQHIAMFDVADHRKLWVGNDGGLSMARDLRARPQTKAYWRKRSHGIIAGQFQDVTNHPTPALNFICGGGLQDNGSWASFGGPTWYHVGRADGAALAFHPTAPDYVFVAQQSVARLASIEATPPASFFIGLSNPVLGDLPIADRRMFVRLVRFITGGGVGNGPFIGILEQDPTTPGQFILGWTASPTKAIAYVFAPPPAPPLANPVPAAPAVGSIPVGVALAGMTSAGGTVVAREFTTAIAFGPVIAGPPVSVDAWIGTSRGQLLYGPAGAAAAGWVLVPTALPVLNGIPRQVTRISVHPTDSFIVAVSTVPQVFNLPGTGVNSLLHPITIRITTAGAIGAAQFTFQIGTAAASAPIATAARVDLGGTFTSVFFLPGAFVLGDSWAIGADGVVTPTPGNTSAGSVTAIAGSWGKVFLTYDRGTTWQEVTHPVAPLPRPLPDTSALPPGPVAALEWDRTNPTQLYAGTLAGVYMLPGIPSPNGLAITAKPATLPIGQTIQLDATLAMTVGPALNCTSAAIWTSSNAAAVTVTNTGLIATAVGAAPGAAATITARRGTLQDSFLVTVDPAAAGPAPPAAAAFAAPAVPIAWRPFGRSLPLVLINDLATVPGTRVLRAASFGRGIWDCDVAGDTRHQLFIRETVVENGRAYPRVLPQIGAPAVPLNDPRLPQAGASRIAIDFTHAFDIRVDAPPYEFFDDVVDGVEFDEQAPVDDAVPFERNFVYVQVHNSGVENLPEVHVHLYAHASPVPGTPLTAVHAVPALGQVADFYRPGSNFDPDPASGWSRIDSRKTVRNVAPGAPVVARFTWTPDDTAANTDIALLALCGTTDGRDDLPAAPAAAPDVALFIPAERRAALRIVHVGPRPPARIFVRDAVGDDTRIGLVPFGGRSPDIIVQHPDIAEPPEDAFADVIAPRPGDFLEGGALNVIYVRVHNRSPFQTRARVELFAVKLDAGNVPDTNLANWIQLPAAAPPAEVDVPAQGVGYARIEWPNPPDPAPSQPAYVLVALVQSVDATDALPSRDRVTDADAMWQLIAKYVDADNAASRAVRWVAP